MNCKYMCMYMYLLEEIYQFLLLWMAALIEILHLAWSRILCMQQAASHLVAVKFTGSWRCMFVFSGTNHLTCACFLYASFVSQCALYVSCERLLWRVHCAALCLQACVPGWAPHVTTVWAVWVAAVVSTPAATPVWEPLTNQATRDQEAAPVLYQTAHGGALVRAVQYVAICLCYGAVQPRGAPLDKVWFRAFPGGPVWLGLPGPVSIPAVTFPARPQLVPVFGRDCLWQKRPYWGPLRVTLHGVWLDAYISL